MSTTENGFQSMTHSEMVTKHLGSFIDRGLLSGVQSIDELISGLKKGTLNVLAARPGIGKTALACQIAYHNARSETQLQPVFFFSLQMTQHELTTRYCAAVAKRSVEELNSAASTPAQWNAIVQDTLHIGGKMVLFSDRNQISPAEIRATISSFKQNNGLAPCLIIIDYFQLMTLKVNEPLLPQNADEVYRNIAKELKKIAQEYDLAVLVLSQVGRSPNGKNELPSPELDGLNEVSDLTFFLHRPDLKNHEELIVSVAKNRHGSTGETTVYYDAPHFTFYDK